MVLTLDWFSASPFVSKVTISIRQIMSSLMVIFKKELVTVRLGWRQRNRKLSAETPTDE